MEITPESYIEEIVNEYPVLVKYLAERGIRCIICGEPIWGTLEEAALEKGISGEALRELLRELNRLSGNVPGS